MKILYLGPEGAHSHTAAKYMFRVTSSESRKNDELIPIATFDEIFSALDKGLAHAAVIPLEHILGGDVEVNIEQMFSGNYSIMREVSMKVSQHVLIHPEADLENIKEMLIHPIARVLVSQYLDTKTDWIQIMSSSSADAAKMILEKKLLHTATIGNAELADMYGLQIAVRDVSNEKYFMTRFVAVVRELFDFPPSDANKCTVLFDVSHTPGGLYNALKALADCKCNLTKIASRPIPETPTDFRFMIDFTFEEYLDLHDFEQQTRNLKVLGIYKAGKEIIER
jgi:prephenate dehydratase